MASDEVKQNKRTNSSNQKHLKTDSKYDDSYNDSVI